MRRFIYLDTETLNSYQAQIYKGLIDKKETGSQAVKGEESSTKDTVTTGASAGGKIFGLGAEGAIEYAREKMDSQENSLVTKDVETKIIHDYAFDLLMKYLEDEELISGVASGIGDYIEIEGDFYILDLDYYLELFKGKGIIEYAKKQQTETIKRAIEEEQAKLPREEQRAHQKEIKSLIKEAIKENDDGYDNTLQILEILTSILPYKRILCLDNYLVVLNDDFLRDNPDMIAFKYGGQIKVMGYITNHIEADKENTHSVFADVQLSINAVMLDFFANTSKLFVLHPIAIYYD